MAYFTSDPTTPAMALPMTDSEPRTRFPEEILSSLRVMRSPNAFRSLSDCSCFSSCLSHHFCQSRLNISMSARRCAISVLKMAESIL